MLESYLALICQTLLFHAYQHITANDLRLLIGCFHLSIKRIISSVNSFPLFSFSNTAVSKIIDRFLGRAFVAAFGSVVDR